MWFQNRRIKWRKHHLELTQQRLALMRHRQIPPNAAQDADDGAAGNASNSVADQAMAPESELSVCDDSMGTESIAEEEET